MVGTAGDGDDDEVLRGLVAEMDDCAQAVRAAKAAGEEFRSVLLPALLKAKSAVGERRAELGLPPLEQPKNNQKKKTKRKHVDHNAPYRPPPGAVHDEHVPWPSIENLGVKFAQSVFRRQDTLSLVAVAIQRWYRFHARRRRESSVASAVRVPWQPLVAGKPFVTLSEVSSWALGARKQLGMISGVVSVAEKLDGTNVGVSDRGALIGRRHLISPGAITYQRAPLSSIPIEAAARVNTALSHALGYDSDSGLKLRTVLYGELMCNPEKFGYTQRGLTRWYCFGARVWLEENQATASFADANDSTSLQGPPSPSLDDNLATRCLAEGHWVAGGAPTRLEDAEHSRKFTLYMSPALRELLFAHDCPTVPPVLADLTMHQVVDRLASDMLDNSKWEGVVMHSPERAVKWKTGMEDDSAAHKDLLRLVEMPNWLIHDAERDFAASLLRISQNTQRSGGKKGKQGKKQRQRARQADAGPPPYDDRALELAANSAFSKFDAPEVYFARGENENKTFGATIAAEMSEDLAPSTPEQHKCIERYANRRVGVIFSDWRREQQMQAKRTKELCEST